LFTHSLIYLQLLKTCGARFFKYLAAELSALRVERERERQMLKGNEEQHFTGKEFKQIVF